MNRIGPQMKLVLELVKKNPGCSKKFIAERISPHPIPSKNWALGYDPINRCIDQDLIDYKAGKGNAYALYLSVKSVMILNHI